MYYQKQKKIIDNWSKWQTIIQIPIVLIMAWATWETYEMRRTSQEQTAKNSMPLVVFDIKSEKWTLSTPILKNVGYGPALNIKVSNIINREFKLSFKNINGLENGGQTILNFDIYDTTHNSKKVFPYDSTQFNTYLSYRGEHFMGRTSGNNLGSIEITYEDLVGNKYSIKQELYFDILDNKLYAKIVEYPKLQ